MTTLAKAVEMQAFIALVEHVAPTTAQAHAPVLHRFGAGIYIREIFMPGPKAGLQHTAIGHRHRLEHWNVMLCGHLTLIDEHTGAPTDLRGRHMFVAPPGRKIAVIHEDTIWWNIIPTTTTDPEEAEAIMLDKSAVFVASEDVARTAEHAKRQPERVAFARFLAETGLTAEYVRSVSVFGGDQIPMPEGWPKFSVRNSAIEGKGVFAASDVVAGEVIAPGRIGRMRTPAGRYTNHSDTPNARFARGVGCIDLIALVAIRGCIGGGQGEEVTVDYRQAINVGSEP